MAQEEKLPWELIEEILSRVPPESLAQFKTVCKRWNALFNDKTFIKNHKASFRFILATKSKIYSVSIDPKFEVRELTLNIPGLESKIPKNLIDCNEFLLCEMYEGAVVWNPCLKQTRWIKPEVSHPSLEFRGIGYECNNRTVFEESGYNYKTLVSYLNYLNNFNTCWYAHDFASNKWTDQRCGSLDADGQEKIHTLHTRTSVSLNGILYWVAFFDMADPLYHIGYFDFSSENFSTLCDLPCGLNHKCDALILKVFKGDRFSLLKQSHETKKIVVWVTKNKINYGDVVWVKFMTLSFPNLPVLIHIESNCQPSYFINDKRLVVCSCDETGKAWIYIMEENKLITKIHMDFVVDPWPLHCSYISSLIPVPQGKREEAEC